MFKLKERKTIDSRGCYELSNEDASFAGIKAHQIYTAFETAT